MSYYILPKNYNIININPLIDDSKKIEPFLSITLYNYFNEMKEQILSLCLNSNDLSYNTYEEIIKIVNPYEYIYSKVPGSKFSVSKLKPKTNMFYDLLEISVTLNIFDNFKNKKISSLHITSNHYDSIECFEMIRENYTDDILYFENINNDLIARDIEDKKFDFLFFETINDNLYNYIISFLKIVMFILRFHNSNGITIIKINDTFHKPVVDILYFLSSLFEKVYIIKPNTNNITSFDKYVVCKNFLFNENKIIQYKINYYRLLVFLSKNKSKNILSIIDNEIPYYFYMKLDDINIIIGQQQLESLDQISSIFKNKNKDEKIDLIKKSNIQKSVSWCEKYKIPCNKFTDKINIFLPIMKEVNDNKDDKYSNDERDNQYEKLEEVKIITN